jgi:hypothetical protein
VPHLLVLTDEEDAIASYLRAYGCAAIVVRPDRYVLGVARAAGELEQLVGRIPAVGAVAAR